MELTYLDILKAIPVLQAMIQLSPRPTAQVDALFGRNARHVQHALDDYNKALVNLQKEYEITEENNFEKLSEEKRSAYEGEVNELLHTVVDVSIVPITGDMLAKCDELRKDFELPSNAGFDAWFMFKFE